MQTQGTISQLRTVLTLSHLGKYSPRTPQVQALAILTPVFVKRMSSTPRKRKSPTNESSTPVKRKVQSATTKANVSNFFKPLSQKEPESTTWRLVAKTLLVGKYTPKPSIGSPNVPAQPGGKVRVAGFDLDSTLISTKSGNKFAKDENDWKWWHASVPSKLQSLHDEGYRIVLFTNQAGIPDPTKDSPRQTAFKIKVATIFSALDIPNATVYAATANDKYRKPRPGMWEELLDDHDLDVSVNGNAVDLAGSYLVGDAAGREGDFSDTDRNWALNLGLGFHTPEEFFLNEPPKPMSHRFDPSTYILAGATATQIFLTKPTTPEVILFVGSPGSGKSTFYRRRLKPLGYEHVNQDTLKTKPRCFKAAKTFLEGGKSIAVDNTNADIATRKLWIDLAGQLKVPIRCVYFTTPVELCMHNAAVRAFGGEYMNPEKREMVPKIAFATFKSRFVEPEAGEGFAGVVRVGFEWEGNEKEREIWGRFWN